MNVLSRRVAKIEAAMIRPAFVPKIIRLMAAPLDDAPDWRRAEFEMELARVRAECDMVIILVPIKPLPHMMRHAERLDCNLPP